MSNKAHLTSLFDPSNATLVCRLDIWRQKAPGGAMPLAAAPACSSRMDTSGQLH